MCPWQAGKDVVASTYKAVGPHFAAAFCLSEEQELHSEVEQISCGAQSQELAGEPVAAFSQKAAAHGLYCFPGVQVLMYTGHGHNVIRRHCQIQGRSCSRSWLFTWAGAQVMGLSATTVEGLLQSLSFDALTICCADVPTRQ